MFDKQRIQSFISTYTDLVDLFSKVDKDYIIEYFDIKNDDEFIELLNEIENVDKDWYSRMGWCLSLIYFTNRRYDKDLLNINLKQIENLKYSELWFEKIMEMIEKVDYNIDNKLLNKIYSYIYVAKFNVLPSIYEQLYQFINPGFKDEIDNAGCILTIYFMSIMFEIPILQNKSLYTNDIIRQLIDIYKKETPNIYDIIDRRIEEDDYPMLFDIFLDLATQNIEFD